MREPVAIILILLYSYVGIALFLRASRHLKNHNAPFRGYQIWRPNLYTDEGQGPRRTSIRFYIFGTITLALALWLLSR